jgi:hypothetical protein
MSMMLIWIAAHIFAFAVGAFVVWGSSGWYFVALGGLTVGLAHFFWRMGE